MRRLVAAAVFAVAAAVTPARAQLAWVGTPTTSTYQGCSAYGCTTIALLTGAFTANVPFGGYDPATQQGISYNTHSEFVVTADGRIASVQAYLFDFQPGSVWDQDNNFPIFCHREFSSVGNAPYSCEDNFGARPLGAVPINFPPTAVRVSLRTAPVDYASAAPTDVRFEVFTLTATPEPASLGLLAAGLVPVVILVRRRRA